MIVYLVAVIIIVVLLWTAMILYMRQAKFGRAPRGNRLEQFKNSKQFRDGKFHNSSVTPQLVEGYSLAGIIYKQFFKKEPRRRPSQDIPVVKIDLLQIPAQEDVLVWFGHSSYFIQIIGKKILVDPVFSGNASPLKGTNRSFKGTDIYTVRDLPQIDYLFITHDHYDHLDYETLLELKGKVKTVICSLGVSSHLEYWGYDPSMIMEGDWHSTMEPERGFVVTVLPSRHFSGRDFSRNTTLWCSFMLQTPVMTIYMGGDSGYDSHFAEIGKRFGPIDLAILDNGQYNEAWRYIHAMPEEVLQAASDLQAKRLFPVHSCKFAMANHSWDEPLSRITALNGTGIPLITPMIGEKVYLKNEHQQFKRWWEGIK
ncbi:MAG TPA: MBL fold metallo-hydrolase [Chitinophagaceae bacterium]|nr:MBL fold metallo-hydrolase [Chitinophagaceae bacterium]